ncbi:peptidoglycan-binding protein [Streptosporangium canum]|uniref:peptidoglycan-binding protein n=1 Tax=Streptosporangium canum TaxID=324952 RepID=UPI0034322D3E
MRTLALAAAAFLLAGCSAEVATPRPPGPPALTEIRRTDLVQSTTVDGAFDYAGRRQIMHPETGTLTTAAREGRTLTRGKPLYAVNARPVVLLYGRLPAYRRLAEGSKGQDVRQLQDNLRALGLGATTTGTFGPATEQAVKRLQKALGLEEPDGVLRYGDVVFQSRPVRVVSADASLTDRVGGEEPVLTVADAVPILRAEVAADLAVRGRTARITLPSGKRLRGKVVRVLKQKDEEETRSVEISLPKGVKAGSGAASVTFVTRSRKNVLAIPVEAVLALREGGYGVQTADGKIISVRTGMSADGLIEVTGTGLREGMKIGTAKE